MRLLIIGAGRLGRAIADVAHTRGHEIVALLGSADNVDGTGIAARAGSCDVAIECSVPGAAVTNVRACLAAGLPVVCGTTGWNEAHARVQEEAWATAGALLIAPNFSLGVVLFQLIVEEAARLFAAQPQYAPALVETHHAAKRDAPSGTARALQESVESRLTRSVPVSSIRVGHVPGTHTLLLDGPHEQIVLTHEARDRRVFADGAVRAAEWLQGRQGVFSMRDVITGGTNS